MYSSTVSALTAFATPTAGAEPLTILIDGPSGAGKTTLASEIEAAWPSDRELVVLHLDDIYPGWNGLDSASAYVRDSIMLARLAGQSARWQRWDWAANAPAEWHEIPVTADLVIEGCGAITYQAARVASASVWVDEVEQTRKARALSRADDDFALHWDEWDAQFTQFVEREQPQRHASLFVSEEPIA